MLIIVELVLLKESVVKKNKHVFSAASGYFRIAILIGIAMPLTISCTNTDHSSVPVSQREIYDLTESTNSVETVLYQYKDGSRADRSGFKVDLSIMPLRFKFPANYYANRDNFIGGAQSRVSLALDPITLRSFVQTRSAIKGMKLPTHKQIEQINIRNMLVQISSNFYKSKLPFTEDELKHKNFFLADIRPEFIEPKLNGQLGHLRMIASSMEESQKFDESWRSTPHNVVAGGINLYAAAYVGYPEPYESERIKFIRCGQWTSRCQFLMYYKHREVEVSIDKSFVGNVTTIADTIHQFLSGHDISAQKEVR